MFELMLPSLLALLVSQPSGSPSPRSVVGELLATDRGFAAKAVDTDAVSALSAMFADDVVMPTASPKPGFARGKAQAIAALRANADNLRGRLAWAPLRGGISADGLHGFTFGYMTLTRQDGSTTPIKYVAYWRRQPEGWRVAVYKRTIADEPPPPHEMMAPAIPERLVAPTTDEATLARHRASLDAAERAFSNEAQTIGLGPAFARHGHADAVNVGPRTSPRFVVGASAIGEAVDAGSRGKPSPVSWAPDEGVLVASSGDLGVTSGCIRPTNAPSDAGPTAIPFITIWRRTSAGAPWRYIAE